LRTWTSAATSSARRSTTIRRSSKKPWRLHQNYALDIVSLRYASFDDGALRFSRRATHDGTAVEGHAQPALA